MGFSPQQARVALATTDTGLDVQAALETLLSNGAASSFTPESHSRSPEPPRDRLHGAHEHKDKDPALAGRRIPGRRDRQRELPARESPTAAERNIQDQADKLLSQASEIGLSMFNRANALWKQGREKVQQAYEERAAASASAAASGSRGLRKDTRPKWMQESVGEDDTHNGWGSQADEFRDDDHEDEILSPKPSEVRKKFVQAKPIPSQQPKEQPPSRARTGDLLSGEGPSVYVSPFRRKTPARSQAPTPSEPATRQAPLKVPSPVPLVQRKAVSASASEITTSAKHKAAGTEMFKLGRYAEAETLYSYAIAALPESHLLLVPLHNNRALTRIKTGDTTGAVDDCTTVLKIIGPGYHPAREAKVTKEDEGASVDLADAYVKALRRRAEAYEAKEKWDEAKKDWESIAGTEWAGKARSEAAQAAGRCRRMLTVNHDAPSALSTAPPAVPKTKPQQKPRARVPTPPSEALNRVREANETAEAEDQEKHELKDSVDARLVAWKGGKESNIRALIASLDTVLWPELGWQKVGMHELVTPAQVKIRYTKAIAKLHPDKVRLITTILID
jgi:tetratricopeptide (TPR) repeat protein